MSLGTLYCLPHAGGGVASYAPWRTKLGPQIEVRALQLPGRESQLHLPPIADLPALVRHLISSQLSNVSSNYFFYGHSMGALLAFELTLELRRRGAPLPRKLYLSGRRSPSLALNGPLLSQLPDAQFVQQLRLRYQGIPQRLLDEPELLKLFLPALRADFALNENYRFQLSPPLDCPILLLTGRDDPTVTRAELEPWRQLTRGLVEVIELPGGHFFLHDDPALFLQTLRADLARFEP
jgi:medium-chain acyl-[acyl-carrier-protein] hydrolase